MWLIFLFDFSHFIFDATASLLRDGRHEFAAQFGSFVPFDQFSSLFQKWFFAPWCRPRPIVDWILTNEIVTNWSGKFLYIFKVDIIVPSRLLTLKFVTKELTCIFWVILFIASTFLKGESSLCSDKRKNSSQSWLEPFALLDKDPEISSIFCLSEKTLNLCSLKLTSNSHSRI